MRTRTRSRLRMAKGRVRPLQKSSREDPESEMMSKSKSATWVMVAGLIITLLRRFKLANTAHLK